jgi:hypothetical protein
VAPLRDAIRYPAKRVLLQRTRLAYVHLRNLLSDAKRDRSARVSGYVAVWMPEELVVLYLEEGEVVNATSTDDGLQFTPIAISDAISRVPASAEYGSVCFHETADELLDLIYASQTGTPLTWPHGLASDDTDALLAYLDATMHDGALQVIADGAVNFIVVAGGKPVRAYFVDPRPGDIVAHLRTVLSGQVLASVPTLRLWSTPETLPAQASPALIQAYRELIGALTAHLLQSGKEAAADVTEGARRSLVGRHPMLDRFSPSMPTLKDPVSDPQALTKAIAAWIADILWAAAPDGVAPEDILRDLTASRRHVFQSAGLFEALPWKVQW